MSLYGAVDIGSNSIRMQAAQAITGQPPRILAEDRQVTRLGEGVFRSGSFAPEAVEETCQVLARMARTLEKLSVVAVRAVATSATRDATNQEEFLERAGKTLGVPVEVISGQEEARLIHLGVQNRWPHPKHAILIVDIGGGSGELIQSQNGEMNWAFSKPIGAVRLTEVFLENDPPRVTELQQLGDYIHEKLTPILRRLGPKRPHRTIATSATAAAVVCALHRIPYSKRDLADRLRASKAQVGGLFEELCRQTLEERREVPGIGTRRAEVIIAGCAVLAHLLDSFALPSFSYSVAGVRDGVIADLALRGVGRELVRLDPAQHRTVREMARRYGVSLKHADKVAALACRLFESLQTFHRLPPQFGRLLEAAAYLHDIGHFVSDSRHHKHSYYLVANSDLAGFTNQERLLIANLCRYHRKVLPADDHDNYKSLDSTEKSALLSLIPLLRLADSLDRGHEQRVKDVEVRIRDGTVELLLRSSHNTDLEEWAARGNGDVFQQLYGSPLALVRTRSR